MHEQFSDAALPSQPVTPPKTVSSFEGLVFDMSEVKWRFSQEENTQVEKIEYGSGSEDEAEKQETAAQSEAKQVSLDEALMERRLALLKKYRNGAMIAAKGQPVKRKINRHVQDEVVTPETVAQEKRRVAQERHGELLSWMDEM